VIEMSGKVDLNDYSVAKHEQLVDEQLELGRNSRKIDAFLVRKICAKFVKQNHENLELLRLKKKFRPLIRTTENIFEFTSVKSSKAKDLLKAQFSTSCRKMDSSLTR
jgi:hypothetical protein